MTPINRDNARAFNINRRPPSAKFQSISNRIWEDHFIDSFPDKTTGPKPKATAKEQFKVLLADLYAAYLEDPLMALRVGLRDSAYQLNQYNTLSITKKIEEIINHARKIGLIDFKLGSEIGGRTCIRANDNLLTYFKDSNLTLMDYKLSDQEVIILRDKDHDDNKSVDVEYKDSESIISMRNDLKKYNELLFRTHIDICTAQYPYIEKSVWNKKKQKYESKRIKTNQLNKFVRRIFSRGSWQLGGRFHGGFWQRINEEERKAIYINGKPTSEQDYSGLHINLLYGLKKHQPPQEDHYVIDHLLQEFSKEEQRKIVKELILMAINVDNEKKAFNAFRHEQLKDSKAKALKDNQLTLLLDAFKAKHPLIKDDLCTGVGNTLMNIDGRITASVINHFTKKDIPVLTIHDSYIIQSNFTGELRKVMNQSISDELDGYKINIKKEVISLNEIQSMRNMVPISEKEDFSYSSVTSFKETKEYKDRLNDHNEWLKEYI